MSIVFVAGGMEVDIEGLGEATRHLLSEVLGRKYLRQVPEAKEPGDESGGDVGSPELWDAKR